MADVNNIISWGLGSPASIKYLITDGLSIGVAAPVVPEVVGGRRRRRKREELWWLTLGALQREDEEVIV